MLDYLREERGSHKRSSNSCFNNQPMQFVIVDFVNFYAKVLLLKKHSLKRFPQKIIDMCSIKLRDGYL